jgi:hypothetical protein
MLIDWYVALFGIVFTALLECVIVAWIYGKLSLCMTLVHFIQGYNHTFSNTLFIIMTACNNYTI